MAELWSFALSDAALDHASARLYLFAGEPAGGDREAAWYRPGLLLYRTQEDPFTDDQLADANSDEHIDLHRVSVFASVRPLVLEGKTRHELQHAVQWNQGGSAGWDCRELVESGLYRAVGGIPGSGAAYNLIPSEIDANAAARRFLIARHGSEVVAELLASPFASLARSTDVERGVEHFGLQHVCYGAIYRDEVKSRLTFARSRCSQSLGRRCTG